MESRTPAGGRNINMEETIEIEYENGTVFNNIEGFWYRYNSETKTTMWLWKRLREIEI